MSRLYMLLTFLLLGGILYAAPVMKNTEYTKSRSSQYYKFYYDDAVSEDGSRRYRIITAVPYKKPGEGGYPVLYALDGNAVIEHITEDTLHELSIGEPPVIVSIGYDTDGFFAGAERTYDYTPQRSDGKEPIDELDASRKGGGADVFLNFIENTVFHLSEKRAFINQDRRTLFGHSYGGLFVLFALSERPGLFNGYVSADPSFWWQRGDFYWTFMQKIQEEKLSGSNMLFLKGGHAGSYSPAAGDSRKVRLRKELYTYMPKDALRRAAHKISRMEGTRCEYREYGWLSHGPLFKVALDEALRGASRW